MATKMKKISSEIRQRVEDKIEECLKTLCEHYDRDFEKPSIKYTKRGTTAGTASYRNWEINLNSVLLIENLEEMLRRTVPHELAHLIAYTVSRKYPYEKRIKPHGHEWQSVMRILGLDPSRCHNYDTTNSRVRRQFRYRYQCGCSDGCLAGPGVHKKIQRGTMTYTCKLCRGKLKKGVAFEKIEI